MSPVHVLIITIDRLQPQIWWHSSNFLMLYKTFVELIIVTVTLNSYRVLAEFPKCNFVYGDDKMTLFN